MSVGDYLRELDAQRDALSDNLNTMGVAASRSEKLNTLVPKVLSIRVSSGESGGTQADYSQIEPLLAEVVLPVYLQNLFIPLVNPVSGDPNLYLSYENALSPIVNPST